MRGDQLGVDADRAVTVAPPGGAEARRARQGQGEEPRVVRE